MAFGKQQKETIREIVAKEIQDILRREFLDLKSELRTTERRRREPIKPKRVGRTTESQYEHGAPGTSMGHSGDVSSSTAIASDEKENPSSERTIGPTRPATSGGIPDGNPYTSPPLHPSGVHEIAHALAKAHMELSEELNANLQTLKDVIVQSQEIARRIETLLGKADSE